LNEHFLALVDLAKTFRKQAKIEKNKVRLIAIGGGRRPDIIIKREYVCVWYI